VAAAVAVEQVLAPTQVRGVLQDLEVVMSLLSWHDFAPAASPWHVTGTYSESVNDYGDCVCVGGG
jgi:hypothetical protein